MVHILMKHAGVLVNNVKWHQSCSPVTAEWCASAVTESILRGGRTGRCGSILERGTVEDVLQVLAPAGSLMGTGNSGEVPLL